MQRLSGDQVDAATGEDVFEQNPKVHVVVEGLLPRAEVHKEINVALLSRCAGKKGAEQAKSVYTEGVNRLHVETDRTHDVVSRHVPDVSAFGADRKGRWVARGLLSGAPRYGSCSLSDTPPVERHLALERLAAVPSLAADANCGECIQHAAPVHAEATGCDPQ